MITLEDILVRRTSAACRDTLDWRAIRDAVVVMTDEVQRSNLSRGKALPDIMRALVEQRGQAMKLFVERI